MGFRNWNPWFSREKTLVQTSSLESRTVSLQGRQACEGMNLGPLMRTEQNHSSNVHGTSVPQSQEVLELHRNKPNLDQVKKITRGGDWIEHT